MLDIWSLPHILWACRSGGRLKFLLLGRLGGYVRIVLGALGVRSEVLQLYSDRVNKDGYKRVWLDSLRLMGVLDAMLNPIISKLGIYGTDAQRVTRFVTQTHAFESTPAINLILDVRQHQRWADIILLRANPYASAYCDFAEIPTAILKFYFAPQAVWVRYSGSEGVRDVYNKSYSPLYGIARFIIAISSLAKSWLTCFLSSCRNCCRGHERYHALTYLYQSEPYSGFSEAFWCPAYTNRDNRKVLGIARKQIGRWAWEFYRKDVSKLIFDPTLPEVCTPPCIYSARLLRGLASRLVKLFFSRLPWSLRGYLSSLEVGATKYEILIRRHDILSVVCWLQGPAPLPACALMLASRRVGIPNFGGTWSSPDCPGAHLARSYTGHMFHWGDWQVRNFYKSRALFDGQDCIGYPEWEKFAPDYCSIDSSMHWWARVQETDGVLVTYYDNVFGPGQYLREHEASQILVNLLEFLRETANVVLVIKNKRESTIRKLAESLKRELDALVTSGRIFFESRKGDLRPGLYSRVVIGIGPATLAMLSATYGSAHVLVYDRCHLFGLTEGSDEKRGLHICRKTSEVSVILKSLVKLPAPQRHDGLPPYYRREPVGSAERVVDIMLAVESRSQRV